MASYDCIVVGVGGVGSFALAELAARGARVLGVDRFEPGHDRGSSHGATRLIRLAYCEHPDYVPLLRRAFERWERLDAAAPERLFLPSGVLEAGPEDSPLVAGVRRAAREHGLALEELTPAAARARFPALRLSADHAALVEPRGGVLFVEAAIRERVRAARAAGAELRVGVALEGWEARADGVRLRLAGGETLRAARLVLAPGAWAPELLGGLGVPLEVVRKVLLWYPTTSRGHTPAAGFLPFAVQGADGAFHYGFPELDARGLKLAEHTGGERVDDPLAVERGLRPADHEGLDAFVRGHLPEVRPRPAEHCVCLYTRTPDEHFLVDLHPASERVALVAGLSGHGFKFAPVLGEALADLALEGGSALPVGFLGLQRFA